MAALPDLGCILNTKCNMSRTIHSINVSTFTYFGFNYVIKLTKQGTRLPKPDVPSRDYPVSTVSSVMVSVLMPVHCASTIAHVLWAQAVAKGMDWLAASVGCYIQVIDEFEFGMLTSSRLSAQSKSSSAVRRQGSKKEEVVQGQGQGQGPARCQSR